jgi:molybdenum cofactor cytidylyltransferase
MGEFKPLLPLGDRPVIHHCLFNLIAAGIQDIQVVIGPGGDEINSAISHLPVRVVLNPDARSEMAASVETGLRSASADSTGVLVCLADHPLVSAATYLTLLEQHRQQPEAIIIPSHLGKKGHPTLFPKPVLQKLPQHNSMRDLIWAQTNRVRLFAVADIGVVLDMDTPEDYQKIAGIYLMAGASPNTST